MSGFVDDWSVACRGINAVNHTLAIVENFERASGQRINYDKSKLVPSRRLSEAEIVACQARWPNLLVSYPERLLGLYLGFDASMADQFVQPLRKFEQALADYERRRSDMSLCTRVIVAGKPRGRLLGQKLNEENKMLGVQEKGRERFGIGSFGENNVESALLFHSIAKKRSSVGARMAIAARTVNF